MEIELLPSVKKYLSLPTKIVIFFVVLYFSFIPAEAFPAPPQRFDIINAQYSKISSELFIDLSLTVDNEDGLRDQLKDGAVIELGIEITLNRARSWWSSSREIEKTYVSNLRHEPLTRDFFLTLPDGSEKRDRNLSRLLHNSWRQLHLLLLDNPEIITNNEGKEYTITITLSLQHKEVPPWLENSFIFWSSDVVPTEVVTLDYK